MTFQRYFSVGRLYDLVSSCLDSNISHEYFINRLRQFVSLIPQDISAEILGFELPLKGQNKWIDFHFSFMLNYQNLQELKKTSICNKAAIISEKWFEDLLSSEREYPSAILEFDVGSSNTWPPQANLFIKLDENQQINIERIQKCLSKEKRVTANIISRLKEIPSKTLSHIGFMLARPSCPDWFIFSTERIYPFSIEALLEFHKRLGLRSMDSRCIAVLEKIAPFIESIGLAFDLTDNLLPRTGIEIYVNETDRKTNQDHWKALITILLSEKIVERDIFPSIFSWCEEKHDLEYNEKNKHRHILHKINKSISHLKLICLPDQQLNAKLYLRADSKLTINLNTYDSLWNKMKSVDLKS